MAPFLSALFALLPTRAHPFRLRFFFLSPLRLTGSFSIYDQGERLTGKFFSDRANYSLAVPVIKEWVTRTPTPSEAKKKRKRIAVSVSRRNIRRAGDNRGAQRLRSFGFRSFILFTAFSGAVLFFLTTFPPSLLLKRVKFEERFLYLCFLATLLSFKISSVGLNYSSSC